MELSIGAKLIIAGAVIFVAVFFWTAVQYMIAGMRGQKVENTWTSYSLGMGLLLLGSGMMIVGWIVGW